jgi:hypothetical protein
VVTQSLMHTSYMTQADNKHSKEKDSTRHESEGPTNPSTEHRTRATSPPPVCNSVTYLDAVLVAQFRSSRCMDEACGADRHAEEEEAAMRQEIALAERTHVTAVLDARASARAQAHAAVVEAAKQGVCRRTQHRRQCTTALSELEQRRAMTAQSDRHSGPRGPGVCVCVCVSYGSTPDHSARWPC